MENLLLLVVLVMAVAGVLIGIFAWHRLGQPATRGLENVLREELGRLREEAARDAKLLREEVTAAQARAIGELTRTVREWADSNQRELHEQRNAIQEHLLKAQESGEERLAKVQDVLDAKLKQLQESNERKLEEMRRTVDEKLQSTLERRLGESFRVVSAQLEAVQQGLGEMRTLAAGVGDLKRVLTNVRERGTWGEYQLGAILEEILAPDQYARNVSMPGTREAVEFAVKLPGREPHDAPVWLPIDSKFPKEDYERLQQAAQAGDQEGVKEAKTALLRQLSEMAKSIRQKYIHPPHTTDFAILFVPTEGLYAEVLREPGFHDQLQREHRVLVAGPTTLAAILNSLRVGFQTLAIERRAHEVWGVLVGVKKEFQRFGEVLDALKKQLNTATKTLEKAEARTRAVQKQLDKVEQLPAPPNAVVTALPVEEETAAPSPDEQS